MAAYYNEINPFVAQWLRNLIAAGHIAPGDVDERSIEDVKPDDLIGYTQCHFFAGIGVWSLALRRAGWEDDRPIWSGSCPCQPFSSAGNQRGTKDERHLWPEFFRLIKERRPVAAVGEQVSSKIGRAWFDSVSSDLESLDYATAAIDTCAAGVGAPHIRNRLYWIANSSFERESRQKQASSPSTYRQGGANSEMDLRQVIASPYSRSSSYAQPLLCKGDDGFAGGMEALHAYGNALHAGQAQAFIEAIMECIP